ncbi:MAG: hypothetical protein ABR985_20610 [Methanotrichaceae archaeon]|jgi:hypothetical protein
MNHEEVLAVLPDSKDEAKSIKEIAQAMGLEISSYVDWVRAERRLVRALGALIRWGWVACDERQQAEEVTKLKRIEISFDTSASVISLDEVADKYESVWGP